MDTNQQKQINELHKSIISTTIALLRRGSENNPNQTHQVALDKLAHTISTVAYSENPSRLVIPLETGMGKTTTIIAALLCMSKTDRSALICVETLEEQKSLYDACIEGGMPKDKIARFHRVVGEYKNHPCIRQEDASQFQFLVICHNKLYSDSRKFPSPIDEEDSTNWMSIFNGKERDIALWDERLEPKVCLHLYRSDIQSALGGWLPLYRERINSQEANKLPNDQLTAFKILGEWLTEASRLLEVDPDNGILTFPQLDIANQHITACLEYANPPRKSKETNSDHILELIELSRIGGIRLLKAHNRDCLIQFQPQIHARFKKLLVFDATFPIRALSKYDKSIEIIKLPTCKSYKNVTINVCSTYSSKTHLSKAKNLENYYQEVDCLLDNDIPRDKEVLIFTLKDCLEEVQDHFRQERYHGRIHVCHWGAHKATNHYSHIKHIFTLGVMRRNQANLIANALGAKDDITSMISNEEIRDLESTEIADMLVQGFGRGHNRIVNNGVAGETTIWLYLPDKDKAAIDSIRQAMPEVVIKERKKGEHFQRSSGRRLCKMESIANQIKEVLFQNKIEQITIEGLRCTFTPSIDSQNRAWHRGLDRFLMTNRQWSKTGKVLHLRQCH